MKKLALALLATTALAPAALADAANFQGPHIGAQLGLGISDGKFTDSWNTETPAAGSTDRDYRHHNGDRSTFGVIGGLHLGWDWVFQNQWLLGIEVAGDLSSLDGKVRTEERNHTPGAAVTNTTATIDSKADMDWSIQAGVRGGVILGGNTLLYLGLNWIGAEWELKTTFTRAQTGNPAYSHTKTLKEDKFLNGFRPAVGVQTALNDHILLGVEVGYSFFEDHSKSLVTRDFQKAFNPAAVTPAQIAALESERLTTKHDPDLLDARIKLSWKIHGIS